MRDIVSDFGRANYRSNITVWLGNHLPSSGNKWDACPNGDAAGFTNWADAPGNRTGRNCVYMSSGESGGGIGRWWADESKDAYHCVCEYGEGAASPEHLAFVEAQRADVRSWNLRIFLGVVPVFILLPWLFVGCCVYVRRRSRSRRESAPVGTVPSANEPSESAGQLSRLQAAERQAELLRARVSGVIAFTGWTVFMVGTVPILHYLFAAPAAGEPANFVGASFFGVGLLFLSLRPTDVARITYACRFLVAFCAFWGPVNLVSAFALGDWENDPIGSAAFLVGAAVFVPGMVIMVPTVLSCRRSECCAGSTMPPRRKLQRIWLTVRYIMFGSGFIFLLAGPFKSLRDARVSFWLDRLHMALYAGMIPILATLILTPRARGTVHRWLGSLGKGSSQQQEAAAVAALISGRGGSAAGALSMAKSHFRALPVVSLTEEELRDNRPNPQLAQKAESATLGDVTAFMSHSWRCAPSN